MEIIKFRSVVFAVLLMGCSGVASSALQDEEITAGCLKINPVMYYVPASTKLSLQLIKEMKASIAANKLSCVSQEDNEWLCKNSDFNVFHGRDGNGKKVNFALICEGSLEKNEFKFYSYTSLTGMNNCIDASWYEDKLNFYLIDQIE